jgi:hypothetical protein
LVGTAAEFIMTKMYEDDTRKLLVEDDEFSATAPLRAAAQSMKVPLHF